MHAVDLHWRSTMAVLVGWALHLAVIAQVSWSVDTTQIQWGEPLTLTAEWALTLEALQEGLANEEAWPNWTDTTSSGFEVLSSTPLDTLAAGLETGADVILRKSWMLTSWDSGFVVMAPERFGPHETKPLLIRVVTPLLEENAQPKPPADIAAVQWTLWERLLMAGPWLLFVVLALIAALLTRWLLRRWNDRTVQEPLGQEPEALLQPAHVTALQALHRLKAEEGWTQGRAKEVQAEASLVLRTYLEGRYGLPAAERTTQEIAQLLPMSAVPQPWHDRLLTGLTQADVVKFAKGHLPDASHVATLDAYLEFVLHTKVDDHEEE